MKFNEAMELVKQGRLVRRASWTAREGWAARGLRIERIYSGDDECEQMIADCDYGGSGYAWSPYEEDEEDLAAEDWEEH